MTGGVGTSVYGGLCETPSAKRARGDEPSSSYAEADDPEITSAFSRQFPPAASSFAEKKPETKQKKMSVEEFQKAVLELELENERKKSCILDRTQPLMDKAIFGILDHIFWRFLL